MATFGRNAEGVRIAGPWGPPPPFQPPSAETREAMVRLYEEVDASLAPAAAACRACGRCCRFKPGGIILFASALELAYLVAEAAARTSQRRSGDSWRCPYQRGKRCSARRARLLGCRTYFCQAEARAGGERIYAEALREIQRIAEGQGPWWYGPARLYLERALRRG
jgi:Fe-S-cluster containining protein